MSLSFHRWVDYQINTNLFTPSYIKVGGRVSHPQCQFLYLYWGSAPCVVKYLDAYLDRTKVWRNGKKQLPLSFIQPHKEVSSSTISPWLKETVVYSGVTKILHFGGHSTRSASTSKAELSGFSVKEVLDRGSWSNESTWQKFYHKEITKVGQDYQKNAFKK